MLLRKIRKNQIEIIPDFSCFMGKVACLKWNRIACDCCGSRASMENIAWIFLSSACRSKCDFRAAAAGIAVQKNIAPVENFVRFPWPQADVCMAEPNETDVKRSPFTRSFSRGRIQTDSGLEAANGWLDHWDMEKQAVAAGSCFPQRQPVLICSNAPGVQNIPRKW